jgi:hypothetical protein
LLCRIGAAIVARAMTLPRLFTAIETARLKLKPMIFPFCTSGHSKGNAERDS